MYINTDTNEYPVSEKQIREANPNVSFPVPFKPPANYQWVFPTPKPEHDSVIQSAREIAPVVSVKGNYEQQWEVVDNFSEYTDDEGVLHTKAEQEAAAQLAAFKATVPESVSMRQARLALLGANLLDSVTAAMTQASQADQIEWEYATAVERNSPLVTNMGTALGMSDTDLDNLFITATTL